MIPVIGTIPTICGRYDAIQIAGAILRGSFLPSFCHLPYYRILTVFTVNTVLPYYRRYI
jgi:hypothetical protein